MKPNKLFIQEYCHIRQGVIYKNGQPIFHNNEHEFLEFIKSAYRKFSKPYPKFYKMDNLSKLAYVTAEVLLQNHSLPENTPMIFSNKSSSLETDRKHQETITNLSNYYPSPAIFVYTLPNICMGEISIRYKLHSENSFFIFESFNAEHLFNYSNALINNDNCTQTLCAWIEKDENGYDAFMYLVGNHGDIIHSPKEIFRLYKLDD